MKCFSCGAEIGLTVDKCPFCGRDVTETAAYRADLESYGNRNEKAKRGLAKALEGNIPLIISAVVMVILVIGICIASYVKENAYSFRSDAKRNESVRRYDAYSKMIDDYLERGDYTGFAAFMEYHNIAEWEAPYDDLDLLWEMAQDYNSIVSEIESSVMFGPEADRYNPESDVIDCRMAIREFYYDYDDNESEIKADKYAEYIHDMKAKADIVLKVYLGLDDSEREAYLASSDIEQEAYLEGVIVNE